MSTEKKERLHCLVMFSGGLDSTIAAHLMLQQHIGVTALHFVLPFESGLGIEHTIVRQRANALGIPLRIEEEGEDFLAMVKNPHFGYGKNANPCVDCRIHRLQKAGKIMAETGARFIVTGEVVGQRPMSQKRHTMQTIESRCGLKGYLLRPLSAKHLEPTIVEQQGLVDRERLLAISGRGRADQLAYAKKFGLEHGTPGGGCILTQIEMGIRFTDLQNRIPSFSLADFKLLAYGRHFRPSESLWLVVGRDDSENEMLERLCLPTDWRLQMVDIGGPLALVRGDTSHEQLRVCASVVARYCRAREMATARVSATRGQEQLVFDVPPAHDDDCARWRIGSPVHA